MTYRNRALLDLSQEAPCFLLPGQHECIGPPSEPCHSDMIRHGRGEHHKSHDVFAVPGCHNAHLAFTRSNLGKEGYFQAWIEAMERFILWKWVSGKIRLTDIAQRVKEHAMEAPKCSICQTNHWSREPHNFTRTGGRDSPPVVATPSAGKKKAGRVDELVVDRIEPARNAQHETAGAKAPQTNSKGQSNVTGATKVGQKSRSARCAEDGKCESAPSPDLYPDEIASMDAPRALGIAQSESRSQGARRRGEKQTPGGSSARLNARATAKAPQTNTRQSSLASAHQQQVAAKKSDGSLRSGQAGEVPARTPTPTEANGRETGSESHIPAGGSSGSGCSPAPIPRREGRRVLKAEAARPDATRSPATAKPNPSTPRRERASGKTMTKADKVRPGKPKTARKKGSK